MIMTLNARSSAIMMNICVDACKHVSGICVLDPLIEVRIAIGVDAEIRAN